jgi:hypothetical protein
MAMKPASLSVAFVKACNQRDLEAIRSLLDPEVSYVRPGPRPLDGVEAIMAQYDEDWRTDDASIEVRRVIEADDTVAVKLTLTSGDGSVRVEAVVIHRWADGCMTGYRLYHPSGRRSVGALAST